MTESEAKRTFETLARAAMNRVNSEHPAVDDFETDVAVRRWMSKRDREHAERRARNDPRVRRAIPPEQWCPHLRHYGCEYPAEVFLTYVEAVIETYNRYFPGARHWANPAVEDALREGADDALVALADHDAVAEFDDGYGSGPYTFRFEGAPNGESGESIIDALGDTTDGYDLRLPTLGVDEYGKILLPHALEAITEGRGILLEGERTIETFDDEQEYRPRIETDVRNLTAQVAGDVLTLADSFDELRTRSRM